VLAIRDRLREMYGRPRNDPHGDPVHELVLTMLSQNTSDTNRDVAYAGLRARFRSWADVRDAPTEEVEEAIRRGGLAPTKAPRIQAALREISRLNDAGTSPSAQRSRLNNAGTSPSAQTSRLNNAGTSPSAQRGDPIDLDWLRDAPRDEALAYLTSLPGVGRKTAACVLIFAFGRPEIPVDTHVKRVGERLGLFRAGASFDEAHDEMLAVTPPEDAYELHMNLIAHGRRLCRPARPLCEECALRRMCPYGRSRSAEAH
jgi:endonuclease-3